MSHMQFTDTPVAVTATIDHDGSTRPETLILSGRSFTIVSVGRQWESEAGRHILVEIGDGTRFELLLERQTLAWRIKRTWPLEMAA
jgi:hypothetical protein